MIKTILFDLDGTLLNTIDDPGRRGQLGLYAAGLAPPSPWNNTSTWWATASPSWWSGSPPRAAAPPPSWPIPLAQFIARYDAHKEDKTAPYPGIPQLLKDLRAEGIRSAVFSNKADALCGGIIDHYFAPGSFAAVRGSRPGVPVKPDPAGLYSLMEELGASKATTLFVGDSNVDIATGHNAGLPALGAVMGVPGAPRS